MRSEFGELARRLLEFAAGVVQLANQLPRTVAGRHVGGQLLRAGTSAGANYEESCASESRADFLHKMQIVLKELCESRFWIRLIVRTQLSPEVECATLLQETEELCRIFAKSIITAKRKA